MTVESCADRQDERRSLVLDDEPFLLVHYTALCNASCSHCVVESGPRRTGRMPIDLATQLIEGARAIPRLRLVVFSGGESFIYLEDILKLCQIARDFGLQTRVISNAYWARTPEMAAAMLERLEERALDQLAISFGDFHRAYIAAERVRNVFLGARQARRAPMVVYSTVNASRVYDEAFV
jgi:MoaA/NifB/PqqE/SkfB family radical SAM enzyme